MRRSLAILAASLSLITAAACAGCTRHKFSDGKLNSAEVPFTDLSVTDISSAPVGLVLKFEAIVVDDLNNDCVQIFSPNEFETYGGDPKWAIFSTPGFQIGVFERLPKSGKARVTGKYIFVRDVQDGPCGVITGKLFQISEIEYF